MTAKHKKDHEADTAKRSSEAADRRIAELEEQVKTLTAERQDFFDKLQRVSADYINYQNRAPKQIADDVAYEKKALVRAILPVLDNLSHAVASAAGHGADESVLKGIQLVFDHMVNALRSLGVERIVAAGNEFDPNIHEAVMQRTDEERPDNTVLEEFQSGYTLNGQVIRPAKVIVNRLPQRPGTDAAAAEGETQSEEEGKEE